MKKNEEFSPENSIQRKRSIRMSLLTSKDDFQYRVSEIRKFIELPTKGLSFQKSKIKEYDNWHTSYKEANIKRSSELKLKIEELNRRVELKPINFNALNALIEERSKLMCMVPENYLNEAIDRIINRYHLPFSFKETIRWYILYNSIRIPTRNYLIVPKISTIDKWVDEQFMSDESGEVHYINIEVVAPLSTKELGQLNRDLISVQKQHSPKGLLGKINPSIDITKTLELARDANNITSGRPKKITEVEEESEYAKILKKKGRSEKEIKKIFNNQEKEGRNLGKKKNAKQTSKDVAKKHLGSSKKANIVRKAKYNIKHLDKKIFPDS